MATVAALWRHPIKGHGREALDTVTLTEGQTMPWDRRWAVAHEMSKADGTEWVPCANFSRGAKTGTLMAISAQVDEASGTVTLTHPDRPDLTFDPEREQDAFLDWVRPLMPADRAQSARLVRVPGRGMTDTDYPSISLINLASNDAMTEAMQQDISPLRWRGNIHLSGLDAWAEFDWVGHTLRIGEVELSVQEPIKRCLATTANPQTGERDADTLATLNNRFGHQDFGIYATVTRSGDIRVGDTVEPV
ncbi:molybdenum cofactor biosysynthesis protein [Roseovarius atlanticus]|uniref:Molybdenum cofactor biosysynthesis protein n=1 Tax=Roseovarius atlanticus TaxID=1641875 RepID=A0A0T5NWS0_9RHOB|nr:MOSC domain-containing protein [Roseovarius atlanticus]KRS13378.1 molybdenum cofactor biosysynthesis protein [Roseovarius atlanticus]